MAPKVGCQHMFPHVNVKVEPIANDKPKILYEGICQKDEIVVLMWYAKLVLNHYQWLHDLLF
jgi:hypothetical protein